MDNILLKEGHVTRGKDIGEEDLSKPFEQTLDGGTRGWFESLPLNSINEWYQLREAFTTRYSIRRACYKEPHEITKVVRRANETLLAFKERWTVETGLIMGVPEVMKISSFMDSIKSPELAKCFSSNIPKTVDEMMRRVDEFVRAEEAYARTELPPGESRDIHHRLSFPTGPRDVHQRLTFPTSTRNDRDNRSSQRRDYKGNDYKNPYKVRDNFNGGRHRDYRAPYPQRDQANKAVPVLSLDSLIKKVESLDEGPKAKNRKGSRQKPSPLYQVIIMIIILILQREETQRSAEATKAWMNTPVTFLGVISDDASDEPLIIEAEVECYLNADFEKESKILREATGIRRQGRPDEADRPKCANTSYPCFPDQNYYYRRKDFLPVEAVMGFKFKCLLVATIGFHQIQNGREDEEKTAFYIEQGTYWYMKMPFGLKNAGATYQRLVDSTFQSQIGRNLEAYVDECVFKAKMRKDLLADFARKVQNFEAITESDPKNVRLV
ncbi:hypothetical protein Tco_0647771 [Tanacetum coccineum]